MTNPTLERAARAAYEHRPSFPEGTWVEGPEHLDLTSVVVDGHANLIEIARAVLMAVRGSIHEVNLVGEEAMRNGHESDGIAIAMIDAILNDGEGTSAGQKSDGRSDTESDGH